MSDTMKPLIYAASEGPLSRAQAEAAFEELFEGTATPAQVGGFLMAMRARGESVAEYAAAAKVMRARCVKVAAPEGAMDIMGTGGDGTYDFYTIATDSAGNTETKTPAVEASVAFNDSSSVPDWSIFHD